LTKNASSSNANSVAAAAVDKKLSLHSTKSTILRSNNNDHQDMRINDDYNSLPDFKASALAKQAGGNKSTI